MIDAATSAALGIMLAAFVGGGIGYIMGLDMRNDYIRRMNLLLVRIADYAQSNGPCDSQNSLDECEGCNLVHEIKLILGEEK